LLLDKGDEMEGGLQDSGLTIGMATGNVYTPLYNSFVELRKMDGHNASF
jgi:hypothetical protein